MSENANSSRPHHHQQTDPDSINGASGGHSPTSPFSLVPSLARSVNSSIEDNSQPQSIVAHTEVVEGQQKPLSVLAEEMEAYFQRSSVNWKLSKILPPRPSADRDSSELQLPEAWKKLQEYSQQNILSLAAGDTGITPMEVGCPRIIVAMVTLLRVVVDEVNQCIGEDTGYSRVIVRINNLLASLEKALNVAETDFVVDSRIVLDDLAEAVVYMINDVSEMRSDTECSVPSRIVVAEKAVVHAEAQFDRTLTHYVLIRLLTSHNRRE
ncbi:uncharacterized protein EV420DRAFT_1648993 [Desarmillaria tabescens]|uniref:Uncharacterized protein n=1 Tax=Armillaria tabescens TaxID=1929756 RepID=A0AA39JL05_ARMTA|nr:uncharacterized protein EV420DRAFT_1648993 [Desarmillaria tabescens]KAK0443880.1 hypothetical protein EV420DRAFT_1648993 [Desarmillaria tabescens]